MSRRGAALLLALILSALLAVAALGGAFLAQLGLAFELIRAPLRRQSQGK